VRLVQLVNQFPVLLYLFVDVVDLPLEYPCLVIHFRFISFLLQLLVQQINADVQLAVIYWGSWLVVVALVDRVLQIFNLFLQRLYSAVVVTLLSFNCLQFLYQ
jgi:hypothetical protein